MKKEIKKIFLNQTLLSIIEEKYKQLNLDKLNNNSLFWKIKLFEGNAIGQIGEKFIKKIFNSLNVNYEKNEKQIHDEYDILVNNNSSQIKFEIKTARKGLKTDSFQFNGINPVYNYDYLILIGITYTKIKYKILKKEEIKYNHQKKAYFYNNKKKLSKMNPNNNVNYKLTFMLKQLENIEKLIDDLNNIIKTKE